MDTLSQPQPGVTYPLPIRVGLQGRITLPENLHIYQSRRGDSNPQPPVYKS
jgi:hypothetical protein